MNNHKRNIFKFNIKSKQNFIYKVDEFYPPNILQLFIYVGIKKKKRLGPKLSALKTVELLKSVSRLHL